MLGSISWSNCTFVFEVKGEVVDESQDAEEGNGDYNLDHSDTHDTPSLLDFKMDETDPMVGQENPPSLENAIETHPTNHVLAVKRPRFQPKVTTVYQVPNDDEECSSFANFVYQKLRKYSRKTRCSVQYEISGILFKADSDECEIEPEKNQSNCTTE